MGRPEILVRRSVLLTATLRTYVGSSFQKRYAWVQFALHDHGPYVREARAASGSPRKEGCYVHTLGGQEDPANLALTSQIVRVLEKRPL